MFSTLKGLNQSDWENVVATREEEERAAEEFKKSFEKYDFTLKE